MKLQLLFSSLWIATVAAMTGCGLTGGYNLPPASRLMEPGPGVGGPGPGVLGPTAAPGVAPASFMPPSPYGSPAMGGGVAGCIVDGQGLPMGSQRAQILFARPEAMQIAFDVTGGGGFDSLPVVTPARQNFFQGGIYRLKLTGIPGREGTELYPTLEVGPGSRRTAAYLAHNAIPIQFTEEDFDQVLTGNFVTKVIYLPDPEFQELALAGVETLVSTRLDPGLDPIVEADRRGAILAVVRIGNKDLEIPGSEEMIGAGNEAAGGVMPANYVDQASAGMVGAGVAEYYDGSMEAGPYATGDCNSAACGCGGACNGACNGACGGACGGGICGGAGAAGFYGPNSTPRGGYGPGGLPNALAGAGQYGLPITGTPIGLPGPPHVPLGVPAGLKKHVIHNWTKRHIPDPVKELKINVKQRPGLSYPQPPNRAWVVEDTIHSQPHFSNHHFGVPPNGLPLDGGVQSGGMGSGHGGLLQALKHKLGGGHYR